ncbi:MAG: DUF5119 domain-containing protein [Prevotellaceae bacterium]|nr:DUF5119 domain-containing protein [Prevotellaceae bacterium]
MKRIGVKTDYDMKRMSLCIYCIYAIVLFVAAALLLSGCQRRELYEELNYTALIPVRIDWSLSGVDAQKMHRASVWFFPKNGEAPLEYRLEKNLAYDELNVPVGRYSVLIFNETVDQEDWNGVRFRNIDKFETFAAMGVPDLNKGLYAHSEDSPLIKNPEPIAAWSLGMFEVTSEMVERTRKIVRERNSQALENLVPALTQVKPLPRYERMTIVAYVHNLSSAVQATGKLDGMVEGVYMASGEKIHVRAIHTFVLNGRQYENNDTDGTTRRTFNIFGVLPTTMAHEVGEILDIDFLLTDGTMHPKEEFYVSEMIKQEDNALVPSNMVQVGYELKGDDHPIILPNMDVTAGVIVNDWDEVIIPVK